MTVAATSSASTITSTQFQAAIASLTQSLTTLNAVLENLQAQIGTGAAAGASTLAGGPSDPAAPPACGCSGATGALGGVDQLGRTAPTKDAPAPAALSTSDYLAGSVAGADGGVKAASAGGDDDEDSDPPAKEPSAKAGKSSSVDDDAKDSGLGSRLVAEARKHLGKKYVWAAAGPSSFDCSGLIQYVAKKLGIDLPHKASLQAKKGKAVDKDDLRAGDLVYFRTGRGISHIGMYVGGGKFIHAAGKGKDVRISKLSEPWYRDKYAGARRLG